VGHSLTEVAANLSAGQNLPSGEMAAAMDEAEELGLPKATVVKVAAEFLPPGVKVNFSFHLNLLGQHLLAPAC
jgi:hypothetical protein